MAKQTVPVSVRALIQRINRKLRADADGAPADEVHATRGQGRARLDLGDYYMLNTRRNFISEHHIDLEDFGRELKVLAAWERLDEGDAK
jgi:hypothetical protein